jgi:hypothetical protein
MKSGARTTVMAMATGVLLALGALAQDANAARVVAVRTSVAYRPHPVARTAAVVGTAVVVGSVVASIPPSCSTVVVNNVSYSQCGSSWYRPAYYGSSVSYTVVAPPQ